MTQLLGSFSLLPIMMTTLIWIYASKNRRPAHSECITKNERCEPTWHQLRTKNTVVVGAGTGQWMQSMWVCVIVCQCVCVGVPVRMFACLHVTECLKLVSVDGKQAHDSKSGTKEENQWEWISMSVGVCFCGRMFGRVCEVKKRKEQGRSRVRLRSGGMKV